MNSPLTPTHFDISLSAGGDGQEALIFGWSNQEDQYIWAMGPNSNLLFLPPNGTCLESDYELRLIGFPNVSGETWPFQRLNVSINGQKIASLLIRAKFEVELFVDSAILSKAANVSILFEFPDSIAPTSFDQQSTDHRNLAIAFSRIILEPVLHRKREQPAASVTDKNILMDLQSLGVNCELGFVQRAVAAEPYGLFRWNSITLPNLIQALEKRFDGLGAPENTHVFVDSASEIMIFDKKYHFRNHSHAFENKGAKVDAIYKRELVRIPQLVKMLIDNLEDASRLFVFHDTGASSLIEVTRLVEALRKYGDNTLLWITRASDNNQAGSVVHLKENLLVGYIDRFQPIGDVTPEGVNLSAWLSVARKAHLIWRTQREAPLPSSWRA